MAEPVATVIIPNYNGMKYLPRLLESLHRQSDQRLVISIIDDQSKDDSARYLREQWPTVNLAVNERNMGFAGTCNAGLRAATTPFVILLNNDTHVDERWLAEGLAAFDAEDVGAVASLVVLADPPHLIDTAGDVYSVVGGALKRNHLHPMASAKALSRNCFSPSGASAFYRRDAVLKAGLLDERFESYYEDVDLGFRLAWAGYRCRFAPASICYHHLSRSYSPKGWRYHFNSARNAEVVWRANVPASVRRRHWLGRRLFLMLQAANKFRQGCIRPYLAGRWSARKLAAQIQDKRATLPLEDTAAAERIESLLEHDWWRLHVTSRMAESPSEAAT